MTIDPSQVQSLARRISTRKSGKPELWKLYEGEAHSALKTIAERDAPREEPVKKKRVRKEK